MAIDKRKQTLVLLAHAIAALEAKGVRMAAPQQICEAVQIGGKSTAIVLRRTPKRAGRLLVWYGHDAAKQAALGTKATNPRNYWRFSDAMASAYLVVPGYSGAPGIKGYLRDIEAAFIRPEAEQEIIRLAVLSPVLPETVAMSQVDYETPQQLRRIF